MAGSAFVVLEGVEGAGKSTQAALLAEWLEARGVPHLLTREPGGTPLGEAVRSLVLGRTDLDVPPAAELFLYLASRAAFVRDVVRPALAGGRVVVADRFDLSTLAYQGYGRGLDLDAVRAAIRLATGGLEPDLTLLLRLPVERGLARQRDAGKAPDRIEGEGARFLVRVEEGYLSMAERDDRIEVVDASGPPERVHGRIVDTLARRLPDTFGEARDRGTTSEAGGPGAAGRGRETRDA